MDISSNNKKELLVLKLKLKAKIEQVEQFYYEIFKLKSWNFVSENDLELNYNSIIELLYPTKLETFMMYPSLTIDIDDSIGEKIGKTISSFMNTNSLMVFHDILVENIRNSGFIIVQKELFLENYDSFLKKKKTIYQDFILNEDKTRFIYYTENLKSSKVFLYKGEIISNKFIKIIG